MDRNRATVSLSLYRVAGYGLLLIPCLFLLIFFVYPLVSIFAYSFQQKGTLDFSGFLRIATSDYYRETIVFTLVQATLSTVLTMVCALPVAYVFVRYQFWGKSFLLALISLPFVLPAIVVATAMSALLNENGMVNQVLMTVFGFSMPPIQIEHSLTLILIVHVFYNFAVALRMIVGYWSNLSPRIEEVGRVLGANNRQIWFHVRLPLLLPILLASALLVFIFTFTSFGVVLIVGGIEFATLEVQIYYQSVSVFNLPMAGALSIVQIGLVGVMMVMYTRLQTSVRIDFRSVNQIAKYPQTVLQRLLVYGVIGVLLMVFLAPIFALIALSLTYRVDGVTLDYYYGLFENTRRSILFVPPIRAVANSLFFAMITMLVAVVMGTLASYLIVREKTRFSRWFDPLFMLPLAVSAVTLGFGYVISFDTPPLNIRSWWGIVPILHTLVALPFVIRSVLPLLRTIPPSLNESAQILGATPFQAWRNIHLPLLSRGLVVGAVFAFTVSMGEFGASLYITRPDTPTIPVVIYRLLGQPRSEYYGQALSMSVVLLVACTLSFLVIERFRSAGVGEF